MSRIQPTIYRLLAQKAPYRYRETQLHRMLRALDPHTCYVSFSAGKDSAVIAHAAHTAHPGIPICMVDPGCPTHWLERERDQWLAYAVEHGWNLQLFPWDKWQELEIQTATDAEQHRVACHATMFADLEAWARRQNRNSVIWGIRASESKNRRSLLAQRGSDYYLSNGRRRISPVADWSTDDIWCYTITHRLPWLSIYDHLGPDARNGLIGRNGVEHGRMAYLRKHFPEAYRHARDHLNLEYTL